MLGRGPVLDQVIDVKAVVRNSVQLNRASLTISHPSCVVCSVPVGRYLRLGGPPDWLSKKKASAAWREPGKAGS
jgi:hypothetical protein